MSRIWLFCLLMICISCGRTGNPYREELALNLRQEQQGYYRARLKPLQRKFTRSLYGQGSFYLKEIQFYASVFLKTPWKRVTHLQFIHARNRCPSMKDDINRDGYLDFYEVMKVSGRILIPLDEDLVTQLKGFTKYPTSNEKGDYYYSEAASAPWMMRDLRKRDFKPQNELDKISTNEELDLIERVLIVYGVPQYFKLPESLRSFDGYPAHMSIPIACAEIGETIEEFP
jgi:hypothetical protein